MWNRILAGHTTRALALAFCLGVLFGGALPELGDVMAYWQEPEGTYLHDLYELCFLVVGILGVAVCGLALRRRLLRLPSDRLVE